MLRDFLQTFLPLYVAIDAPGLVPLFLAVTGDLSPLERRRISAQAVAAATVITLAFMFGGESLFRFIGIENADFKVAGGVILLILAVVDILTRGKPAVHPEQMIGIVPLATPLIAGPGAISATILLATPAGLFSIAWLEVVVALLAILILCYLAMLVAIPIQRLLGLTGLAVVSRVVGVLLAALAMQFLIDGIAAAALFGPAH